TAVQGSLTVAQDAAITGNTTVTGVTNANGGVQRSTAGTLLLGTAGQTQGGTPSQARPTTPVHAGLAVNQDTTVTRNSTVTAAASVDGNATVTGTTNANGGVQRSTAGALNLGTAGATNAVNISQAGQTTTVQGGLVVDENTNITGSNTVTGAINANGGVQR